MTQINSEVNQIIHEQIMGKCWHEAGDLQYQPSYFWCNKCHGKFAGHNAQNPNYCESIKDAFDVVEKLREVGSLDKASLNTYAAPNGYIHWEFKCSPLGGHGMAQSPEMAICLAALKTLEK